MSNSTKYTKSVISYILLLVWGNSDFMYKARFTSKKNSIYNIWVCFQYPMTYNSFTNSLYTLRRAKVELLSYLRRVEQIENTNTKDQMLNHDKIDEG